MLASYSIDSTPTNVWRFILANSVAVWSKDFVKDKGIGHTMEVRDAREVRKRGRGWHFRQ